MRDLFIFLLLNLYILTNAKSNTNIFIQSGGTISSFQDTKFSSVIHNGKGLYLNLGVTVSSDKNLSETGLSFGKNNSKAGTHNQGNSSIFNPILYTKYYRKINHHIELGISWDILNLYLKESENLKNNDLYFISSSDLYASGIYYFNEWKFTLNIGIISLQKENTSFASPVSQEVLKKGKFSYQNDNYQNWYNLEYYKLMSLNSILNIKTDLLYQLNNKFNIGYSWSIKHFSEIENYPVSIAKHQIVLVYNIFN